MTTLRPMQFDKPGVLDMDAKFMGATVRDWDQAMTGTMQASLDELKKKAFAMKSQRKPAPTTSSDLASAAKTLAIFSK